jgi:hypothetical protein
MTRTSLLLVAALILGAVYTSASADAQTVTVVDKTTLNLPWATYWPVELDGRPDTLEFMGYHVSLAGDVEQQVAVVRQGLICLGAWFVPWTAMHQALNKHGLTQEFLIGGDFTTPVFQTVWQNVRWMVTLRYDLPPCGGVPWVTGPEQPR